MMIFLEPFKVIEYDYVSVVLLKSKNTREKL